MKTTENEGRQIIALIQFLSETKLPVPFDAGNTFFTKEQIK